MKRFTLTACALACVALLAAGCSQAGSGQAPGPGASSDSSSAQARSSSARSSVDIDDGTTDRLYSDDVYGAELYVFQFDDVTRTIPESYSVNVYADEVLENGGFYKVVADVTYLNGGVAGYVNFPEIKNVESCEEVSPFEIGLPSIEDTVYGLALIGDYAEGDILLNEWGTMAVWKDGAWTWRYDSDLKLDDGTRACVRKGVTEADVKAGIDQGILSCEDYFVLPAQK